MSGHSRQLPRAACDARMSICTRSVGPSNRASYLCVNWPLHTPTPGFCEVVCACEQFPAKACALSPRPLAPAAALRSIAMPAAVQLERCAALGLTAPWEEQESGTHRFSSAEAVQVGMGRHELLVGGPQLARGGFVADMRAHVGLKVG